MNKVLHIDASTGEQEMRDETESEISQREIAHAEYQKDLAIKNTKATAKKALIDRLGLTTDEAALLLG
jgi:hypothetical protein